MTPSERIDHWLERAFRAIWVVIGILILANIFYRFFLAT